jgi:uncharacterized membrane protein YhaH (DUF805 family)
MHPVTPDFPKTPYRPAASKNHKKSSGSFYINGRKLATFDGRIGRQTFWRITLLWICVLFAISVLQSIPDEGTPLYGFALFAWLIGFLLLCVISWATACKRFHDRNKSGQWALLSFVPIIGQIWVWIEMGFLSGHIGDNQYGEPESGSPFEQKKLSTEAVQREEWQPPSLSSHRCVTCGEKNPSTANYCANCGGDLHSA